MGVACRLAMNMLAKQCDVQGLNREAAKVGRAAALRVELEG